MSEGCHKIIKEGATLIHSVEDILNEYQLTGIIIQKILKNMIILNWMKKVLKY